MDNKESKKNKIRNTSSKPRSGKKRNPEGPSCSMFLVDLSRKLAQKRKAEEELQEVPTNIVGTILDSLTNALPVVFTKSPPVSNESPLRIETLQSRPDLQLTDLKIVHAEVVESDVPIIPIQEIKSKKFKIPKMPVTTSDVFKQKIKVETKDVAINTSSSHDMACSLAKYVDTLKKISLIAEEFNQKTAKNLKEIVDSVQEDLQQKLEELVNEQKHTKVDQPLQVVQEDIEHAGPV